MSFSDVLNIQTHNMVKQLIPENLQNVSEQLAEKAKQVDLNATNIIVSQKADKSEVTNVMTPKGSIAYASLPTTGNTAGWYWYCPDGDGMHGAGNYVWNGTVFYFGGTGDEGYSLLSEDMVDISNLIETEAVKVTDIVFYENKSWDKGITLWTLSGYYAYEFNARGRKKYTIIGNGAGKADYSAIFMLDSNDKVLKTIINQPYDEVGTVKTTIITEIGTAKVRYVVFHNANDGGVLYYPYKALDKQSLILNTNSIVNELPFVSGYYINLSGKSYSGGVQDGITDYTKVTKGQKIIVYGNCWTDANLISYYDDNKAYLSGVAGEGLKKVYEFVISANGFIRLCVNYSIVSASALYGYLMTRKDTYVTEKLRSEFNNNSTYFNKITTDYRYLCLTFTNTDQKLNLLGSNDCFATSNLIKANVFTPSLGRKTFRDPSWMYYKGYYYIVYNVEAMPDNPLYSDTDFDEIGVVKTKDFVTFYEYPHIHLSVSGTTLYDSIWAPAFCVIDNKCYIATWAKSTEKGEGAYLYEYNPKSNTCTYVNKLNSALLDTHVYKINGQYYAIGNNDGELGIKICKSNSIDGTYTKIQTLATSKYYEGAYLMTLDNGKWRIFITDNTNMYYCDSITTSIEGVWSEPIVITKNGYDFGEAHFTIIDTLSIESNELK